MLVFKSIVKADVLPVQKFPETVVKVEMSKENYLSRCYELAELGKGYVSPNPLVGAVIVKNGEVIAEGYHKRHGDIHAEIDALNKCNEVDLSDAVLYCSLEPCSHNGSGKINPPCTEALIRSGIKKIVIGIVDPNPKVSGKGVNVLRENGIDVSIANEQSFIRQNRFFIKNMKTGMPFVTMKIASSLDGKLATKNGHSKWITSEKLRKIVHEYRHEHDAVLIGSSTAMKDNPELTVRHINGQQPYRIVIDSELKLDVSLRIFSDKYREKTILVTSTDREDKKIATYIKEGIRVIQLEKEDGHISLKKLMKSLYDLGIRSVLVEPGKNLGTAFLKQILVDELIFMFSNKILGEGISVFSDLGIDNVNEAPNLKIYSTEIIKNEMIIRGTF